MGTAAKLPDPDSRRLSLTDLLLAAPARIGNYFPGKSLVLDLISDPDTERPEQADHLVLLIATDLDVPEAMAQLQQLEVAWWLEVLPQAKGALSVDLLFV